METIRDYFGNELTIGDKIVFAKSEHSSLAIGEITKIGKTGTTVDVKILFVPFGGYWKAAKERVGDETRVMLKKTVEETVHYKGDDEIWYVDTFDTDYVYAMKYDGVIPEEPQYHLKGIRKR